MLASCYYDPYAYNPYPGSYSGGYSGGYSGSVFVSTGDARWGYDPYRYCYYDYYRRCYYDPYLCGYYPVGCVPTPVYGCPHPSGWRPGHGHCPPPGNINERWIDRYHDRVAAIQATNYAWASKVRANRQAQAEQMRDNQAALAHRVTDARQTAVLGQQSRNAAIRNSQQAWAERVRANRQPQAGVLRSGPTTNPRSQIQSLPPGYRQQAANQNIARQQAQWADKVRAQRAERQVMQAPPTPPQPPVIRGGGGGGKNPGGNRGGGNQGGGQKGGKWAEKFGNRSA